MRAPGAEEPSFTQTGLPHNLASWSGPKPWPTTWELSLASRAAKHTGNTSCCTYRWSFGPRPTAAGGWQLQATTQQRLQTRSLSKVSGGLNRISLEISWRKVRFGWRYAVAHLSSEGNVVADKGRSLYQQAKQMLEKLENAIQEAQEKMSGDEAREEARAAAAARGMPPVLRWTAQDRNLVKELW